MKSRKTIEQDLRLLTRKEDLNHINKIYLIRFAEREIKEWQQFIEDIEKL